MGTPWQNHGRDLAVLITCIPPNENREECKLPHPHQRDYSWEERARGSAREYLVPDHDCSSPIIGRPSVEKMITLTSNGEDWRHLIPRHEMEALRPGCVSLFWSREGMRHARPRGMNGRTRSHPKVTGKRAWNKKAVRHEVEGTCLKIIRSILR